MKRILAVLLISSAVAFLSGNALALETYIPHITGGETGGWTDYLQVNNNTSSTANFTLTLYNGGNQIYSNVFSVGGLSRSQIELKALHPYAETGVITYTESGLVFRVSYNNLSGGIAEFMTIDTLEPMIGLYFSDFTSFGQWKGAAIANMGSTPAEVTLYALGGSSGGNGGSILGTHTATINPKDKLVGTHSAWFSSLVLSQVESIVAVTSSSSLCGIAIGGDLANSRLLFTPATPVSNFNPSNYHPVNLQGTWNGSVTYTASSDGNPSQWNYSGAATLNADGTVSFGSGPNGIWWSYSNMLIIGHPWQQGVNYGVDCHFLNLTSVTQASGLFEDKNMSGSGWWGRGNSLMTRINNTTSSSNDNYHPVNLQGTWNGSVTYTASSDGNPSQWNYYGAATLNADGTVSFGSGPNGIWWSYSNMLIIGHPWQQGVNYGVDCHFLNLTSVTQASGLFEDKNMSGSGWWGRGNSLMTKQ